MRKIVFLLVVVFSSFTYGQTEFSIHITSDVAVDSVSVSSFNLSKRFSTEFINEIATVKIPSNSSDQYSIFIKNKKIDGWFNAGKSDIYLDFKNNTLRVTKTKNTPVYKRQVAYFKEYKSYLSNTALGTDFIKNAILQNDQDAFILVPINHYLKLHQNDSKELEFIEKTLQKQPESTRAHSIYSMIERRLQKVREIKQIALDQYSLIDTNGAISKIETNTNKKYTVLDFWFTSCPPCIKEHKEILENPKMFQELNAELIGISTDTNQEKWVYYLEQKKIPWKNYRINKSNFDKDLGIWSFPTYIILDNTSTVLGSYSNIAETIAALKQ